MKYQDPNAAPKVSLAIADDKVITHVYKVPSKTGSEPQLQGAAGKAVNSQLGVGNFAVGELQPINTESLVFLIQTLVAKGSWHTSQDASIMSLPDRLLIRHRHDVQKEIQELLDQLSVSVLNPYGRNNRLQMSGVGCGGQGGGFGGGGFGGGGAF